MADVTQRVSDESGDRASDDDAVVRETYEWHGKRYEVDLLESEWTPHAANMDALVAMSREIEPDPAPAPRSRSGRSRPASGARDDDESKAARKWAKEHGIPISDRGRAPSDVVEAYRRNDPESVRNRTVDTSRTKGAGTVEPGVAQQGDDPADGDAGDPAADDAAAAAEQDGATDAADRDLQPA